MAHSDKRDALNFGTAGNSDGESIRTAFPKLDEDIGQLFTYMDKAAWAVEFVEDLSSLDVAYLEDGDVLTASAYEAEGDGRGARYTYRSSSSETVDGLTVIDGPGSAGRFHLAEDRLVVDTTNEFGAITGAEGGLIVLVRDREASYQYSASSGAWAWHSGAKQPASEASIALPETSRQPYFHGLDVRKGREFSRIVNGTARLVDQSRTGTPRQLQPGRCVKLDGVGDYVEAGGPLVEFPGTYTFSAWVNPDSFGGAVFAQGGQQGGWAIFLNSGNLQFASKQAASAVTALAQDADHSLALNSWAHIAVVARMADANTLDATFFIDGVEVEGTTTTATGGYGDTSASRPLAIGVRNNTYANHFAGCLADARIFGRALSASEIARIAAMEPGNPDVGPLDTVLHYKGDEGAGSIAYDSSGNGNHGTITATSLSTFHNASENDVYSWANEVGHTARWAPELAHSLDYFIETAGSPSASAVGVDLDSSGDQVVLIAHVRPTKKYKLRFEVSNTGTLGSGLGILPRNKKLAAAWEGFADAEENEDNTVAFSTGPNSYITSDGIYSCTVTIGGLAGEDYYLVLGRVSGGTQRASNITVTEIDGTPVKTRSVTPRDESNPSQDVLGNALEYSGPAPRDAILSSPCLTLNGTSEDVEAYIANQSYPISVACRAWVDSSGAGLNSLVSVASSTTSSQYLTLIYDHDGPELQVYRRGDGGATRVHSLGAITEDQWHNIAVRFNAADAFDVWVDGAKQSFTGETSVILSEPVDYVTAGQLRPSKTLFFKGRIADVQVAGDIADAEAEAMTLSTGRVLSWTAAEGSGTTIYDVSGNGNHGTATLASEATAWANTQDKFDTLVRDGAAIATKYDGSSDYYDGSTAIGDEIGSTDKLSVSCWFFTGSGTNEGVVCFSSTWPTNANRAFEIVLASGDTINVRLNTASVQASGSFETGKWTHVAAVYDGAELSLYINGGKVDSVANSTDPDLTGAELVLGGYFSPTYLLDGLVSQVAVEQAAWTAAQVREIMAGDIPGGAWYFRDGDGYELQKTPRLSATKYNGDYFRGSRVTSGALSGLSVSCWIKCGVTGTTQMIAGEEGNAPARVWYLQVNTLNQIRFVVFKDGSNLVQAYAFATVTDNRWHHIAATFDAGTVKIFVDGEEVSPSVNTTGSVATLSAEAGADIWIGRSSSQSSSIVGDIAGFAIEGAAWTAAQVREVMAGQIPAGAWYFPAGDGTETQQGLAKLARVGSPKRTTGPLAPLLAKVGSPSRRIVPAGAGIPVAVGPGVLMPGQEVDLTGDEADSPHAQKVAALLSSTVYEAGDDSDSPDLFVRKRELGEGDDRLQVFDESLEGDDLTKIADDVL